MNNIKRNMDVVTKAIAEFKASAKERENARI